MTMAIKQNGYIVAVGLPPPVLKIGEDDRWVKRNAILLDFETDYWYKGDNILFTDGLINPTDVVQISDADGKVLWSWSSVKGDIILDGKLVALGVKKADDPIVQTDKCKKCGGEGEVRLMACICMECGSLIWGI
jgi:hypothetical protein